MHVVVIVAKNILSHLFANTVTKKKKINVLRQDVITNMTKFQLIYVIYVRGNLEIDVDIIRLNNNPNSHWDIVLDFRRKDLSFLRKSA